MNPKIKILPWDFAIIQDDTHIGKWIEDTGNNVNGYFSGLIAPHIKPGNVVLECGAYIGDQTVHYAKAVGPSGIVLAFEPNPLPFECLQYNIRTIPQALAFPVAIGYERGKFGMDDPGTNYGATRIIPGTGTEVIRIDDYPLSGLSFLKMDIEGMEMDALMGADTAIENFRPIIYIEVHNFILKTRHQSFADIRRFLEDRNYNVMGLDGNPLADDNADAFDMLAKPKS